MFTLFRRFREGSENWLTLGMDPEAGFILQELILFDSLENRQKVVKRPEEA